MLMCPLRRPQRALNRLLNLLVQLRRLALVFLSLPPLVLSSLVRVEVARPAASRPACPVRLRMPLQARCHRGTRLVCELALALRGLRRIGEVAGASTACSCGALRRGRRRGGGDGSQLLRFEVL